MGLSVTTIAPYTRLARRSQILEAVPSIPSGDYALVDSLIDRVSAAILGYTNRRFAREALTETLPGWGDLYLQLQRAPVISVSAVSRDGSVITDYSIDDADQGTLYRQAGWDWTAQAFPGLAGDQLFLGGGYPMPRTEQPLFSVSHVAGYIMPDQHLLGVSTLSAAAADNSFNDSASGFPALLKAGDVVEARNFNTAANNGRHIVTGTPTTAKIVVAVPALVTEAAAAGRSLYFRPPAHVRPMDDVEWACIEAVVSAYQARGRDVGILKEKVGDMELEYAGAGASFALPASIVGRLRSWVRSA